METEIKIAEYGKDIEYMKDKIEDIHDQQLKLGTKLDTFIESADKKYAGKQEFEWLRNTFIGSVIIAVFGGIMMKLIFK